MEVDGCSSLTPSPARSGAEVFFATQQWPALVVWAFSVFFSAQRSPEAFPVQTVRNHQPTHCQYRCGESKKFRNDAAKILKKAG